MAAIPVTFIGQLTYADYSLGGGPMPGGPGGPPPIIWPGPKPPYVDAGLPGPQPPYPPQIWPGPRPPYIDAGFPIPQPPGTGTPPLEIWGPIGNYPDAGFPAPQPPPGSPPRPTQPIYYPPVIWDPARPANPIVNPGDPNDPGAGQPQPPKVEWKTAWSPTTGWIVVGIPTVPVPTPSA